MRRKKSSPAAIIGGNTVLKIQLHMSLSFSKSQFFWKHIETVF